MYGKIFESIYDGSLRENWKALITFQQFIILKDENGIVDMTAKAISARTGIPLEIIEEGIEELEKPDLQSRSAEEEGRRLVKIDISRNWGWYVVNSDYYRKLVSRQNKLIADSERMALKRKKPNNIKDVATCRNVSQMSHIQEADTDTDTDTDKEEDIQIPLRDKSTFLVSQKKIQEYKKSYPNINIQHELRMIRQWNIDNPEKRKTKAGILRHINSWLTDTANKRIASEEKPKDHHVQYQARDWKDVRKEIMETKSGE